MLRKLWALVVPVAVLLACGLGTSTAAASCTPAEQHTTAGTGFTAAQLAEFVADVKATMGLDDCELNAILDDPSLIAAMPVHVDTDVSAEDPGDTTQSAGTSCKTSVVYATYRNHVGQTLMRYMLSNYWCWNGRRVVSVDPWVDFSISSLASALWDFKGTTGSSDRYLWFKNVARGQFSSFRKAKFELCVPFIGGCVSRWYPSLQLYVRANGTRTGYINAAAASSTGPAYPPSTPPVGDPAPPPADDVQPPPPGATTGVASAINGRQATLGAAVDPQGLSTTYHFEYGSTAGYGSSTSETSAGAGSGAVGVSATISGLAPLALYHYRVVATSDAGTSYGSDQTLRTLRAVSSFNGDAAADLIFGSQALSSYAVTTSTGSQLGGPGTQFWLTGWDGKPEFGDIGDFDGNGKTDLVVRDVNLNTYAVALSDGARLAAPGGGTWFSAWPSRPDWMRAGDFNGDGKSDLLLAYTANGAYGVALSDGTRFGAPGTQYWLTGWDTRPQFGAVGDFNGDGKDDLVVRDPALGTYAVALSDGTRLNAPGSGAWFSAWPSRPDWMRAGDFNGDGKDDLILGYTAFGAYGVVLSDGARFGAPGTQYWLRGWDTNPEWGGVADFNGDGKDDLVVRIASTGEYAVALSDGAQLGAPGTGVWFSAWPGRPDWLRFG